MEATENLSIDSALDQMISPELLNEGGEEQVEEVEETEEEVEETEEEVGQSEDKESDEPEESDDEETEESEEDDVEDEEPDAVQESPDAITVKVDGEEQQVTLDELKQGYSGQKYVQQGMQEAARKKKEAEQVYQALQSERQKIAELHQSLQQGGLPSAPNAPTKELFDDDPIGYMEQKIKYDEDVAAYNQKMQEVAQVNQQNTQAVERANQAYAKQEAEALKKVLPEFAKPDTATQAYNNLVKGGVEHFGYRPEDIEQVVDHKAMLVLHDAIKYRELMNSKSKVKSKSKNARPVIKPGAKKTVSPKRKTQRKKQSRFKQTGKIEDAIDLLFE